MDKQLTVTPIDTRAADRIAFIAACIVMVAIIAAVLGLFSRPLPRQALMAVKAHVVQFRSMKTANDRNQAIALCVPLPVHFAVATDAALPIANRRVRFALKPDVEKAPAEMDYVAEFLTMAPRLTWDRVFARAFDAENALRRAMGMSMKPRPYEGQRDPQQALAELAAVANGGAAQQYGGHKFSEPSAALRVLRGIIKRASILTTARLEDS